MYVLDGKTCILFFINVVFFYICCSTVYLKNIAASKSVRNHPTPQNLCGDVIGCFKKGAELVVGASTTLCGNANLASTFCTDVGDKHTAQILLIVSNF